MKLEWAAQVASARTAGENSRVKLPNIHKSSAAVPQSSVLTALRFLALLGVLYEYPCAGRGVARLVSPALAPLRDEDL